MSALDSFTYHANDTIGNSNIATVSINVTAAVCTAPPTNMMAWYPGDGNGNEVMFGNNGTFSGGATYVAGKVGQAFSFDGVNAVVTAPNTANLQVTSAVTIDAWINPSSMTQDQGAGVVAKGSFRTGAYAIDIIQTDGNDANARTLRFFWHLNNSTSYQVFAPYWLTADKVGTWRHIAATYDSVSGDLLLYDNGVLIASAAGVDKPAAGTLMTVNTHELSIGSRQSSGAGGGTGTYDLSFNGSIDEVEIFNRALSAAEIKSLFDASFAGKCNTAPVADDQMVATNANTAVGITLGATDAEGNYLTYTIVDAPDFGVLSGTAPNLTYTPNAGYYGPDSFTFKANDGFVDSNIATVSIDVLCTGPTVTADPDPVSITYGSNAVFTASADGVPSPTVQWQVSTDGGSTFNNLVDGLNITGSASPMLTLTGPSASQTGHLYKAVFTSDSATAETTAALLTISKATLTVTADDQTITYGDPDPSPFTFQYGTEFVLGDDAADIDVAPTCTVSGPHTNVATYPIVCSGGSDDNYAFSFVDGTLTVDPATLDVNAVADTKEYGESDPAFNYTLSGFKFSENEATAGVSGSGGCSCTPGETVAGGPYTITCTAGSLVAANYVFATGTTADFTITPATLSVNAAADTKEYGESDPALTYTLSGFKFSENETTAGVSGSGSCSRTPGETVAGGPYTITCTAGTLVAANYVFATGTTANFTITPATLSVNAAADTKEYGESDPAFNYTLSGFKFGENEATASVSGSGGCSHTPGETVAGSPYTITCTAGSLVAANYVFATGTTADFTITPATLSVDAVANSKIYGDGDPALTYTLSGFKFSENEATAGVSGSGRAAARARRVRRWPVVRTRSPARRIPCRQRTMCSRPVQRALFTITPRSATWTTDPNSKTYGDSDPIPLTTGSGSNFVAADNVMATYTRVAGENASPPTYPITATLSATPLSALDNYIITNDGAEFTINKRLATWTTDPNSKTYGDPDPAGLTTGSGSNFVAADNVMATYTRVAGENASPPTYHITATLSATPLSALDNYIITNDGAEFTINKRLATWTTDPNSKTYGDPDPAGLTTGSGSNFVAADNVMATYTRVAGENASPPTYPITATLSATPLSALDNYIITNDGAEFTINKRLATWTTDPNSKTYGDPDPAGLTTGSGSNFVAADNVMATYTRVAGENASPPTYPITATLSATPLSALDNYIITNDGAEFTINKRLATWTTDPNSKTYGDPDPAGLTTGSGSNFVAADNVMATYTRVAGENASPPTYPITATLSATPLSALDNYIITNDGAEFTINKRLATWTTDPNSKTYGDPDPAGLTTGSGSNFVAADNVMATYTRVAGENASPPTYPITATLSATPLSALDNYIITNDGAEFTINKRLATWTTDPNSKTYGDPDPAGLTTGSGSNFVAADNVMATYTRVAGENASPPTYPITATLSATPLSALDNYIITNDGAEFTINKRLATWTTDPNSKTYGDPDPAGLTTGSGSNFVAADNVMATYTRVAGENASPPTYPITATLSATPLSALDNYIITNDGAEFTINKRLATWTTDPNSKTYGDPDPAGLTTGSGSNFVAADNVMATYTRVAGENASPPTYHITATLSATPLSALDNYIITNDGAEFTIDKTSRSRPGRSR